MAIGCSGNRKKPWSSHGRSQSRHFGHGLTYILMSRLSQCSSFPEHGLKVNAEVGGNIYWCLSPLQTKIGWYFLNDKLWTTIILSRKKTVQADIYLMDLTVSPNQMWYFCTSSDRFLSLFMTAIYKYTTSYKNTPRLSTDYPISTAYWTNTGAYLSSCPGDRPQYFSLTPWGESFFSKKI